MEIILMESKCPTNQEPKNLRELIQLICLRPVMFTGSRSFVAAAAFIEGYYYACSLYQPEALGSKERWAFDSWLAVKLNATRNVGWSYNLHKAYPDDEEAFKNLALLYEEFLNSSQ
jgi:hypothetical protein